MRELSLHILDIAENSLRSGASLIEIKINEDSDKNLYQIIIEDDGCGMSQCYQDRVLDPFVTERKTRNVGLGLPLFKQTSEMCSGELILKSDLNKGTIVEVNMKRNHIDMPPMGSITDTIISLILAEEECDICFVHKVDDYEYTFSTKEIKEKIEDVDLNDSQIINWIKSYLENNENNLREKGALL